MVFGIEFLRWCLGINAEFPSSIIYLPGSLTLIMSLALGLIVFSKMKDTLWTNYDKCGHYKKSEKVISS